jgi:prepilin-type N-terminal cleavage/methylation domain-containing protein
VSATNKGVNSNGFSLFELIIVIFIIGLVYSLITITLPKQSVTKELNLLNLQKYLQNIKKENSSLKLICVNSCSECYIIENDTINRDITIELDLDKELEIFKRDVFDEIRSIEFNKVKIDNEEMSVCMELEVYNNLSTSSFIIENYDSFYAIPSFFKESREFNTKDEAVDYLYSKDLFPTGKDDYYD